MRQSNHFVKVEDLCTISSGDKVNYSFKLPIDAKELLFVEFYSPTMYKIVSERVSVEVGLSVNSYREIVLQDVLSLYRKSEEDDNLNLFHINRKIKKGTEVTGYISAINIPSPSDIKLNLVYSK